jgi:hypothetical protein
MKRLNKTAYKFSAVILTPVSKCHAMKTDRGSGGLPPRIINLRRRWKVGRRFHNEELHNLNTSSDITRRMKSRRKR